MRPRNSLMLVAALTLLASPAIAQTSRPAVRASFFTNSSVSAQTEGASRTSAHQVITAMTLELNEGEGNGVEYALDFRQSDFLSGVRNQRLSIYDAYLGGRVLSGRLRARVGGMWLTELGGLGAVAGGLLEVRQQPTTSAFGRLRGGVFFGAEPSTFEANYVHGVRKYGAYGVLDGAHGRKHSGGYVRLEHSGLLERSVLTFTNFVPVKSRVFVYQSAEYDLVGPAGQGRGGLSYLFVNGRTQLTSRVDLQGNYHRGRSIDARSITDDVLSGRPIPAGAIDGLLFESAGGRVTVEVARRVRVHGGYARDRSNRDSTATGRLTAGGSAADIARTGLDLTVSVSRTDQPNGRYGSIYASVGRQIGRPIYLSADYSSSLAVVSFLRTDGIVIESRPSTRQIGGSAIVNIGRRMSMLLIAERAIDDSARETRLLTGLTYRFR